MHCDNPDHDNPRLVCGYTLPCPWHTATIHTNKDPVTVEIPVTAKRALRERSFLADVADIVAERKA
jgi:hypothetical protein